MHSKCVVLRLSLLLNSRPVIDASNKSLSTRLDSLLQWLCVQTRLFSSSNSNQSSPSSTVARSIGPFATGHLERESTMSSKLNSSAQMTSSSVAMADIGAPARVAMQTTTVHVLGGLTPYAVEQS